jgi:hypothetical protein
MRRFQPYADASLSCDPWQPACDVADSTGGDFYREHARLAEEFDLDSTGGATCFFGVGDASADSPTLVVAQRYVPAGYSFYPGILIVPETGVVFIGAGERLHR